ncbi:MAG: cytidine deaminase [Clostridia bacterium]|jgi:dCMP deaminase|nr:cytidine deaminase [Clostridia bacterium]
METRIDKINYYLNIAKSVADRSTCLRKKSGAVIVNKDEIIATGYSGAPRGRDNCIDLGYCCKKKFFPNVRHAGYDACRSVHAEQNALLSGARKDMIGGSLYLVQYRTDTSEYEENAGCCQMCRKMIINAGIEKVVVRVNDKKYQEIYVEEWIKHDDLLEGKINY